MPSYKEGYPNALLEAMASGLPVIATRVGAITDLISEGESGLLIEPGNTQQLAEKLSMLIRNGSLRKEISAGSRKRIISNNTMVIGVTKFQKLLESLC